MVRFVFLRHGYSITNKTKRFTGQMDAPLDDLGFLQAAAVAKHLLANYQIDCIYSSDLCRTMDTVRPYAEAAGLPIHEDKAFREIDVGQWENLLFTDIRPTPEYQSLEQSPWLSIYGKTGECYHTVALRTDEAIRRIAGEHDGETVLISTHGGTLRALLYYWSGCQGEITDAPIVPNASLTVVEWENDTPTTRLLGDAAFLGELATAYFAAH